MLTLRADFADLVQHELGTQEAAERAEKAREDAKREQKAQENILTAPLRAAATDLKARLDEIKALLDAHGVGKKLTGIKMAPDSLGVEFHLNNGRNSEYNDLCFTINADFCDTAAKNAGGESSSELKFSAWYETRNQNGDTEEMGAFGELHPLGQQTFASPHELVTIVFSKAIAGADNKKLAGLRLSMGGA
jgi:hypothetical protein